MKKSNRWLKSVTDAKKKFYTEILDSFQNFKSISMRKDDAFIDGVMVLELLDKIDLSNIVYLRARQIFVIQMVLINNQSKEQISIMNKVEDIEKKLDLVL